jgi:peptide/nickel transport system permease protein
MTVRFVANRFGLFLLIVLAALTLNFLLPRMLPGDPVQRIFDSLMGYSGTFTGDSQAIVDRYNEKYGLNLPLWQQFFNYLGDLTRFDLGHSIQHFPAKVTSIIGVALPWTVVLLLLSSFISFTLGTVMGALIPWPGTPKAITGSVPGLMVLAALPPFLLGIVLIFLFIVVWPWFPAGGGITPGLQPGFNFEAIVSMVKHAAMPATALVFASTGFWALAMRGMTVSVLGEDYIMLARAKGIRKSRIFFRYGLRTAMLPQITALAMGLGNLVGGAILVEAIFAYPGVGTLLFQAIGAGDYFMLQGLSVVVIITTGVALLLLDLIYPLIDPRIGAG